MNALEPTASNQKDENPVLTTVGSKTIKKATGCLRGCLSSFWHIVLTIVIPVTVFFLNKAQTDLQMQIADQRAQTDTQLAIDAQRDGIVSAYVKDMTDLMTNKDFNIAVADCEKGLNGQAETDPKMQRVIRGRTLLALAQAKDGVREGQVLRFFVNSGLSYVLDPSDLEQQDFTYADLTSVCLSNTDLSNSDFTNARLNFADMTGAQGWYAIFEGANLWAVNLSNADLRYADFKRADLWHTNLSNANLSNANLSNANLEGALNVETTTFDEKTMLPDSTDAKNVYWTSSTDMKRYTDPTCPDFWQPDWAKQLGGG
jgi:uncharacterized protein YjbI with pentapeptide repeats